MLETESMTNSSRRAHLHLLCSSLVASTLSGCRKSTKHGTSDQSASKAPAKRARPAKRYRIGWCARPSWMPFKLMQTSGLLEKRAKEFGVNVELVQFEGYTDLSRAFVEKKLDGVTLTTPQLMRAASQGRQTVAVLATANPKDAYMLLVRQGDLGSIDGERVPVEVSGPGSYLIARALKDGKKPADLVTMVNVPVEQQDKLFLSTPSVVAISTSEPALGEIRQSSTAKIAYSSKEIPNELIDFLALSKSAVDECPELAQALCAAWFDVMAWMHAPKTNARAIQQMALHAGMSPKRFKQALARTELLTTPAKVAALLETRNFRKTIQRVYQTCVDYQLVETPDFAIGFNAQTPGALRFDLRFFPGKTAMAR